MVNVRVRFLKLLTLAAAVVVIPTCTFAQTGSAALTGSVLDGTGAPIPGVKLSIINEESGAKSETLANESGAYRVASLVPGAYRVEAAAPGFDVLIRRGIVVT